MPTWLIVVLAVVGVLIALALGGAVAGSRRRRRVAPRFEEQLDEVNRALATARAGDRGWDAEALEAAAHAALARERPGVEIFRLVLAQVLDRPGTEEDKAVFRAIHAGGEARVTLGRVAGEWTAESVVDSA
jgi:type II secretory pathway pseudopilin PulG